MEAGAAFDNALGALDLLYRRQLKRSGKEIWLATSTTLAMDAAYVLAWSNRPSLTLAVKALEAGRARLMSESLARRAAELDRLGRGERARRPRAVERDALQPRLTAAPADAPAHDDALIRQPPGHAQLLVRVPVLDDRATGRARRRRAFQHAVGVHPEVVGGVRGGRERERAAEHRQGDGQRSHAAEPMAGSRGVNQGVP